jgi:hypothetical protein
MNIILYKYAFVFNLVVVYGEIIKTNYFFNKSYRILQLH